MKKMIVSWLKHKAERSAQARAQYWFARLQSGTLSEQERLSFEQWLAKSMINQRAFVEVDAAWHASHALACKAKPKAYTAAPKAFWLKDVFGTHWTAGWAGPIAATIVVAVALLSQLEQDSQVFSSTDTALSITLEDGSQLTLQPQSQLEVAFSRSKRGLKLVGGEVFFDVARDVNRPFMVDTPKGTVTVLGTQFAVSLLAAQKSSAPAANAEAVLPKIQVTVIEGRVAVTAQHQWLSMNEPSSIELTANQQLDFASLDTGHMPSNVNAKALLAWRQERLVYRGEKLSTVLEDLSEYFGRPISLAVSDNQKSTALLQEDIIAVIKLSSAEAAAQALANSLGLQLKLQSDGAITLY